MIGSGIMSRLLLRPSDINVHGGGCVVATREKTTVFLSTDEDYCLHYVLFLMQLSVSHKQSLCCFNLIPDGLAGQLS